MAQDLKTLVEPNIYELSGEGMQISYSTSGIEGSPSFSYRGPKGDDQTFSGDEIETLDTALGTEVTVTVADVADLHVITLTLVIPEMWVAPGSGLEFKTIAIYVTREEPFTGKIGLPAAREQFATVNLEGEGKLVEL
jgi:hypothetical protein